MIACCHDSQDIRYRKPTGALQVGENAELCIRAEGDISDLTCNICIWQEGKESRRIQMKKENAGNGCCIFQASVLPSAEAGICWYYFILEDGNNRWFYGNNEENLGGKGATYIYEPPAFQITVYRHEAIPDWYRQSIVYQIFPDRFSRDEKWLQKQQSAYRGDEWRGAKRVIQQDWYDLPYYTKNDAGEVTRWPFFGGTLKGIGEKLFYLKSMGVSAVYLNPIFTALSNHKYDTADYMQIDPAFGTEEDFRNLCRDAAKLNIRIILDGVFNHTGADSRYFDRLGNYARAGNREIALGKRENANSSGNNDCICSKALGACQGEDSPYYSWYRFEEFPGKYDSWWGVADLPCVDENDPSYRRFIYKDDNSVVKRWISAGASGWRLDVADELPDDFIAGIRDAIKSVDPDGVLLGEVWEDASNKISYGVRRRYLLGEELDSTMNYPACDLLLDYMLGRSDAGAAVRKLNSLAENYPPENFYGALNLIGSHDRARVLTVLGDAPEYLSDMEKQYYKLPEEKLRLAKDRLKALSAIQYMLPGVPCLYYGDEAGLQGYEDPYNRAAYPWGREDDELMTHYRMLAQIRKQYTVLTDGKYSFANQGEHVFICERFYDEKEYGSIEGKTLDASSSSVRGEERIIAVVNRHIFGSQTVAIDFPEGTEYVLELISSEEIKPDRLIVELPPVSVKLYYCKSRKPEKLNLRRSAGVLCHVSSLPSGCLDGAEDFIDRLAAAGQRLWQVLPLNPVDEKTGSPYSGPAVFAYNSMLTGKCFASKSIGEAIAAKNKANVDKEDEYIRFCKKESYWLDDYALYTVIKESFGGKPWQNWPEPERERKNLDKWKRDKNVELDLIKREQFEFDCRWKSVKEYANNRGISIIGDIPVYPAVDSADTWAHRGVFLLDEDGYPQAGAGVPPDYFSKDGQNWGNPLYDWDALKNNDYMWWLKRVERVVSIYDYIRLDHFRSFAAFFAIPGAGIPRDGWWLPGAGHEFFKFIESKLGKLPFLAEDLGALDSQVYNLLKLTGYPGMLVYQFSAQEIETMDVKTAANRILYSGTHDNRSLAGWCEATGYEKNPDEIIQCLYESKAPWVILPLQDIMGLGDESRMNVPGKAAGNWNWRAPDGGMTYEICSKMRELAEKSGRYE